ncbi:MAG TPA: hypothetical protein VHU92_20400, partial [Streptosporangiaceae bacterium]|nr:hypothetical protein [Streptosporangiaceae bacterium]
MSSENQPLGAAGDSAALSTWERLEAPALAVLPYVMLVAASAFTPVVYHGLGRNLSTLGIAALAGAWLLWGFTLHPAWRERPRWMAVFFGVLLTLMAVLVIRA